MSAIAHRRDLKPAPKAEQIIPLLRNGDRLSQREFHRRYETYPDKTKFELIDGVVYMASPMTCDHSDGDVELNAVFALYKAATPGVGAGANPTVILGDYGEPQPDHLLRILPEYGGQTKKVGKYLAGGPELIAEVAFSSVSIDLHLKRRDYQRAGVGEYLVVCLEDEVIRWFDLTKDSELEIGSDGVLRSWMFPGLWIDVAALFRSDTNRLVEVLQQGLAAPEHGAFVEHLAVQKATTAGLVTTKKSTQKGGPRKRPKRK